MCNLCCFLSSAHLVGTAGYDTKLSNGEASIQDLWGMQSTPSLTLLPGPL